MRVIKDSIAHRVNELRGTSGSVWQEGFFDKMARTMEQLNAYIEYTHNNPVKALMLSRAEDYSFSSANGDCMKDYQEFLNG